MYNFCTTQQRYNTRVSGNLQFNTKDKPLSVECSATSQAARAFKLNCLWWSLDYLPASCHASRTRMGLQCLVAHSSITSALQALSAATLWAQRQNSIRQRRNEPINIKHVKSRPNGGLGTSAYRHRKGGGCFKPRKGETVARKSRPVREK